MSMSVCGSVCVRLSARIFQEPYVQTSSHFLCMLPVAVDRSFSGGVPICFVLPVLWMTSCFFSHSGPRGGMSYGAKVVGGGVCDAPLP